MIKKDTQKKTIDRERHTRIHFQPPISKHPKKYHHVGYHVEEKREHEGIA
jgi:ribosomal protein S21